MGLFSFLKSAGTKLFGKKEEKHIDTSSTFTAEFMNQQKASLLKELVAGQHLNISNLDVQVNDDHIQVSGEAATQADREKAILTLGNVEGVATVEDNITVAAPVENVAERVEAQFYEVKKGDSLSKIAKALYGDAMKYPVIFEANKPMLKDPDLIYPGQMLRIPQLEA